MKKKRLTHPSRYKTRESYLNAKINNFNVVLAAFYKLDFGSAYLPKGVRDDLRAAKQITYDAACNLITYKYKKS